MAENTRKNPLCVISVETFGEYAVHDIQTNNSWSKNPYGDNYAVVPDEMVEDILETKGFCDITLNDTGTEIVSFVAREIPEIEPDIEPTADDDIDAMLVDHEYRLTLLELGVNE